MEFFVHNFIIHSRAAQGKPTIESDTMTKTEQFCVFLLIAATSCVVSFVYWALLNSMK
jgi:hypothetical protein